MIFETNILLISFAVSVVLAIIIIPILRKLKVGQVERAEGPESHLKKQGTPTMGGIIMIITMILVITGTYLSASTKKLLETTSTIGIHSTFADTNKKLNNDKKPPVIELRL